MGTVLNQAKEALRTYEQVKEDAKKCILCILVQRILSNCYIDLSDFSSAALSSIAVATATPHSSALQLKKSSCVNIAET